jgi:transposase-like protein
MKPKRTEQRRRRIYARQRAHLVERFQRNGLTRIAFARRHGFGLSTFGKWLSEARAASP